MKRPGAITVPNGIKLLKIPKNTGFIGDPGVFGLFVLPRNGPRIEVNTSETGSFSEAE